MARALQAVTHRDHVRVLAAQAEAQRTGRPALAFLSRVAVPVDADVASTDRAMAMMDLGEKLQYAILLNMGALVFMAVRTLKGRC